MTPKQEDALDRLLSYVIDAEERDYDGSPDHIYRAIYVLARMRGVDDLRSPADLDRERDDEATAA